MFLHRLLQESPDAEDCLQETFLRAYRAYDRLDRAANLRAWLYRIAYNVAMTGLRRRTRQLALPDTELAAPGPSVERQVEQQQLLEGMRRAVWALPTKQRAALVMRKYQELSYAEIGQSLEITAEAARANVYQGMRKLRQQFAADGQQVESGLGATESAAAGK